MLEKHAKENLSSEDLLLKSELERRKSQEFDIQSDDEFYDAYDKDDIKAIVKKNIKEANEMEEENQNDLALQAINLFQINLKELKTKLVFHENEISLNFSNLGLNREINNIRNEGVSSLSIRRILFTNNSETILEVRAL